MRITEQEKQAMITIGKHYFGEEAKVYLFGSRADLHKKGGDIDLYVETNLSAKDSIKAKISFLVDLKLAIGEQKIDVVVKALDAVSQPIYDIAKKTGILLC